MKRTRIYLTILLSLAVFGISAAGKVNVKSPNGKIVFELVLKESSPVYQITFNGKAVVQESPLTLVFDDGAFGANLKMNKVTRRTLKEQYELVVGKSRFVNSHSNEVVIPLEEKEGSKRKMVIAVRAFDDGVAFRYEFPEQAGRSSFTLYEEGTFFNLAGNPKSLVLPLPSYLSSHEGLYTFTDYNNLKEKTLMDMPATFEFSKDMYLSITEAAMRNYPGMYLWKENGTMTGKLSPKLGQDQIKVEADLPHVSPWRVFMISDRVGTFIESDILTNLNEPCKIEDTSWIKPGKTTFTWWNGNVVPDTTFSPGNNFDTNKYYIDFASRSGLDFHSIYGYAETPWYVDDGFNFSSAGPNTDITKSIAPLDMKYICDYAKSQGVDIHVWLNWRALYRQLEDAFAQFQAWGVKGMMVDFMDRDDQEMIRIQEEILATAAKYELFIQFHGSSKPSGLHRTYPNEFTREGTLNYEVYKWDTIINADHDISMPFARLLAGAADYHLGGFRSVPRSEFKIQFTNPLVTSTRCHMLAMYVVLESYLGMVCDTPWSYEGQPGFDFLQAIPTVWDKTVVPDAIFNEYVTVARQKNNEWYIGSLNNSEARTVKIPLKFLDKGSYEAIIYTDANDVDRNPDHLVKETRTVTANDILTLPLASEGGAAVRLVRK